MQAAMHLPVKQININKTRKQKTLSTLANVNSAVGHTAGVFGGIAAGVNVTKAMENNGVNTGLSVATGVVSALVIIAAVSITTECVSGALRKKAGVDTDDFNEEDYGFLFENSEDNEDVDELTDDEKVGDS